MFLVYVIPEYDYHVLNCVADSLAEDSQNMTWKYVNRVWDSALVNTHTPIDAFTRMMTLTNGMRRGILKDS